MAAVRGQPRRRLQHHRRLPLLLLVPLLATTRCWTTFRGPFSGQRGVAHRHTLLPLHAPSRESCSFTQSFAVPYSSGSSSSDPVGPGGPYGMPQASGADAEAQQVRQLFQQMLNGEVPPGAAAGPGGGFGGAPGGPGGLNAENPLAALLGGGGLGGLGGQKKAKATDAFFTDRLPLLQKVKRPIMIAFFAYCFYRGWIGRFGLLQGCISSSYFDMLAVPARVDPRSWLCGRPFIVSQLWVDYFFKALGFLLNLARGKTSIREKISEFKEKMEQMQSTAQQQQDQPFGGPGSPFGGPGSPWNPAPTEQYAPAAASMPTAPTTTVSAQPFQTGPFQAVPQEEPEPPPQPPTSRQPPPVVDADVRFLD